MPKVRISLWLFDLCAIRSQPITIEEAAFRIENWKRVFGDRADIRQESVDA